MKIKNALVEPFLPILPRRLQGGRPRVSDRGCLTGIVFVLRSGIPWQMLPQELGCGSGMTCWRRLRDWQRAGVWDLIHFAMLDWLARDDQIEWSRAVVDSCSIRAVYGGDETGPNPTDRAKRGSKRHLICDGRGVPLAVRLTGANRNDSQEALALVDAIPPLHGARGRPRQRPDCVLGDRGYDAAAIRRGLRARHIVPWIAMRRTAHGSGLGRWWWVVERTFAWLNQFRRLRVRYDKRVDIHEAFLSLACAADLLAVAAEVVQDRLSGRPLFSASIARSALPRTNGVRADRAARIIHVSLILTPGTRLGVYDITAQIGEGGMGQVFRATDRKLKRQVAIKILPPSLAADHDRLARFQREAEVLASLNHPNIAAIYGLEEGDGISALVMELVEGDDLSQRIARGAIPMDEALPIAKQIADALEAAHEHGIIHRDLKPANIKVRPDGVVKVLDFGLAKAMEPATSSPSSMSMSPTLTTPAMTQAGMILGTVSYMAPEQAKGKAVDKRADIWAFGAVLYELLTGARAFQGEDVTDAIVAVVSKQPDWTLLPTATPDRVRQLLRRSLIKDPKQRLRDIGDARIELDAQPEAEAPGRSGAGPMVGVSRRGFWITVSVAALVCLTTAAVAYRAGHSSDTARATTVVATLAAEPGLRLSDRRAHPALSPDGTRVVYPAIDPKGIQSLWVRPLAEAHATRLAGTDGATFPFWSPDGRSIGFFANDQLRTMDASGGPARTICSLVVNGAGASWGASGDIILAASQGMIRARAEGGACESFATELEDTFVGRPSFLPDGRRFVYGGNPGFGKILVGDLETQKSVEVLSRGSNPLFVPPHWLFFLDEGLYGVRLDPSRLQTEGEPFLVQEGVISPGGRAVYTATSSALVAMMSNEADVAGGVATLWVDRRGQVAEEARFTQSWGGVALSGDGRYLAASGWGLWIHDISRGVATRANAESAPGQREAIQMPAWSPTGEYLAYRASAHGRRRLRVLKLASGTSDDLLALEGKQPGYPSWFPDGRSLIFVVDGEPGPSRSEVLSITLADRKTQPLFASAQSITHVSVSPDGQWLAYASTATDRPDVFLRPITGQTAPIQVSLAGGDQPRWRSDGGALFFVASDGAVMEVEIRDKPALDLSKPRVAVQLPPQAAIELHEVSRDGLRFLITERPRPNSYTLVLDWASLFQKNSK